MVHLPHANTVQMFWKKWRTDSLCLVKIFLLHFMLAGPVKINWATYQIKWFCQHRVQQSTIYNTTLRPSPQIMVASTSWMKSWDAWLAMVSHLTSLSCVLVSFPGLEGSIPIILILLTNKNVTLIYWQSQLMNKKQKILRRRGAPNIN